MAPLFFGYFYIHGRCHCHLLSFPHTHTHTHEPNCLFCFVVQGRQERERNEKKEEDLDDYSKRGGLDASFKRSVSPNMSLSIYGQSPIFCSFSPWLFFFFLLLLYRLLLMVFTRVSILLRNGLGEPVIHLTILPPPSPYSHSRRALICRFVFNEFVM